MLNNMLPMSLLLQDFGYLYDSEIMYVWVGSCVTTLLDYTGELYIVAYKDVQL